MTLQIQASLNAHASTSSPDYDVYDRCLTAKQLEAAGEYQAARTALGDRWQRVGERPRLDDLSGVVRAELLLRAGTLTGWIGSSQQIEEAQEFAKDLISESLRGFTELGLTEKVADAQVDLAVCYWRAGALDEARVTLTEVLNRTEEKSEPRLRALANLALLERVAGRYREALDIQTQAAPLFEQSSNHALRGNFHNVSAQVLKELGLAEHREEYIDRALMEYTAASYHFEQAGHARYQGRIENNLGSLFTSIGRHEEAYEHLDRARALFVNLKDRGMVAHVDETCARTLLAEGRNAEAVKMVSGSVRVFEAGDESSALAEALTTQGTALARLEEVNDALDSFQRAIKVAEQAGDNHARGLAALAVVEELSTFVAADTLRAYYLQAESVLPGSQNPGIKMRLGECARRILTAEDRSGISVKTATFAGSNHKSGAPVQMACVLEEEVLRYEGNLIKRALQESDGSVTRAARLLGVTHQGLAFILNGRHKSLLSSRKPAKPRRRSIIRYH